MATNSTAIELTWQRPAIPNGIILHYSLSYSTSDGGPATMLGLTPPTMTSFTVTELNEHTEYVFTLAAVTTVGAGPSAQIMKTTAQDGQNF